MLTMPPRALSALAVLAVAAAVVAAPPPAQATSTAALAENFDGLTAQLKPRVDETTVPADVLGFSPTAPPGWTVTTSPVVAASGVTEWRGWSFTTPQFWSTAAPGQGRENFTKAEGVLAVADDDEWDDKNNPADTLIFDSALTSPAIDVAGKSQVHVNYDSSYRQTGPQQASLEVSFDGGPRTKLFTYSTSSLGDQTYLENRTVTQPVKVPAGAQRMTATWNVEKAQNDWYWAIDDVDITDQPREGAEAPMPHNPGPGDLPNGTSHRKVLFVDVDGVRYDRLLQANTPHLDALAKQGQFGPSYLHDNAITGTNSGPGHSNMLTGVWPDKHKVMDNSFAGNNLVNYPDVTTRLERANPALSTFTTLDWTPLNQFLIASPDVKMQQTGPDTQTTDRQSTSASIEALSEHNPDFVYTYLHQGDATGHGIGSDTPQYVQAIENLDAYIGQLVQAMRSRPTYKSENWLVIVSTDHGSSGQSHGGDQHTTRTGWILASGGDITRRTPVREWRQVDVTPTILKHLRVPVDPAWNLDGIPIGTPSNDPFDTVKADRPVVDEPAKPPASGGWTPQLPTGWARTGKVEGGVTEFRGWNLMTNEFWATSGEGEGRGSFVRSRDVVAVADAKEWSSANTPAGTFDSTLWSPWHNTKGRTVTVEYASHYKQPDGEQKAEVIAEFDNGTTAVLWSADTARFDISKPMSLQVKTPPGAGKVRIGWHLTGDNGYWAIDAPTLKLS
ncbi:hypothetical protein GCM10027269_33480 [Kribbella endophytica]